MTNRGLLSFRYAEMSWHTEKKLKPDLHISRKDRKQMLANMF